MKKKLLFSFLFLIGMLFTACTTDVDSSNATVIEKKKSPSIEISVDKTVFAIGNQIPVNIKFNSFNKNPDKINLYFTDNTEVPFHQNLEVVDGKVSIDTQNLDEGTYSFYVQSDKYKSNMIEVTLKEVVRWTVTIKCSDGKQVDYSVIDGESIQFDYRLNNSDYGFSTLYLDEEYKQDFGLTTPIEKNITLYLKWLKKYTVRFEDYVYYFNDYEEEEQYQYFLEGIPQKLRKARAREDYVLEKWSTSRWYDEEENIKFYEDEEEIILYDNLCLYPVWRTKKYKIIFHNGNDAKEYEVGFNDNFPTLSELGFQDITNFCGWSEKEDGDIKYSETAFLHSKELTDLYAICLDRSIIDFSKEITVSGGTVTTAMETIDPWYSTDHNGAFGDASVANPKTINSFSMLAYDVTYGLWTKVYDWAIQNGYNFGCNDTTAIGKYNSSESDYPIRYVSFRNAIVWCNAYTEWENAINNKNYDCVYYLDEQYSIPIRSTTNGELNNTKGSQDNPYIKENASGWRLPTEGEWEFAARGGDEKLPEWNYLYCSSDDCDENAWDHYNTGEQLQRVGLKKPNRLGFYDMCGNVWEWTHSIYSEDWFQYVIKGGGCYDSNRREYNTIKMRDRGETYFRYGGSIGAGYGCSFRPCRTINN